MPILEGGENEDKLIEQTTTRMNIPSTMTTTTLDWTPAEYEKIFVSFFVYPSFVL